VLELCPDMVMPNIGWIAHEHVETTVARGLFGEEKIFMPHVEPLGLP
jgi:hypothetical protein